jgi:hypothetical protein
MCWGAFRCYSGGFRYHVNVSGNAGAFQEFWLDRALGADTTPVPCYAHILKWSEDMQGTIRKYNLQYLQALTLFKEIQELVDNKKRMQTMSDGTPSGSLDG